MAGMVKVDFSKFTKNTTAYQRDHAPAPHTLSERALRKVLLDGIMSKSTTPRGLFNMIRKLDSESQQRLPMTTGGSPDTLKIGTGITDISQDPQFVEQRVTSTAIAQLLAEWGFGATPDQIAKLIAPYESERGRGLMYADLSAFVDEMGPEERARERVANEAMMLQSLKARDRGGPLSSTILQPTADN